MLPSALAEPAPATSASQVVTLHASADAYVSYGAPTQAYGLSSRLTAGSFDGARKVAYLRFAVPSADVKRIESARLTLTRDLHHLSGTVAVHSATATGWSEQTVTAKDAPQSGPVLASQPTDRSTSQVSFDVSGAVRGRQSVAFAITSSLQDGVARFASRQAPAGQPELRLTLGDSGDTGTQPSPPPAAPAPPAPPTSGKQACTITQKLVPSCGRLWGIAPGAFTSTPVATALAHDESLVGRSFDIVHTYHRNGELFPTPQERALALQPGSNRLLYLNWKPATDMTWAQVAAGKADNRIDAEAAYLRRTFPYPFFLTVWHEPENDVNENPGSGMTASDFAAMFRHVVTRLRADGVTNAVTVMNYMGFVPWAEKSWFSQLWPGDSVVDWIGIDPYATGDSNGYSAHDFNTLVNRRGTGFPGFYTWATTAHSSKPIIVAEWGVRESQTNPGGKPAFYRTVAADIGNYPRIKALDYFDSPKVPQTAGDYRPNSTPQALAAFKALSHDPAFNVGRFRYESTGRIVVGG